VVANERDSAAADGGRVTVVLLCNAERRVRVLAKRDTRKIIRAVEREVSGVSA
jgi:hypothetical protein